MDLAERVAPMFGRYRKGSTVVRYRSALGDAGPGGDWFDVISSRRGPVLVVGDVAGHDASAAALMWEIRARLRSALWDGKHPAQALSALNDAMTGRGIFGTCCCVQVTGSWATMVSAGHLPPIVSSGAGRAMSAQLPVGIPIGVQPDIAYEAVSLRLQPGACLALYTDGLVERRGESITDGIDRLALAMTRGTTDLDQLADTLISELAFDEDEPDDTTLLLHRVRMDSTCRSRRRGTRARAG